MEEAGGDSKNTVQQISSAELLTSCKTKKSGGLWGYLFSLTNLLKDISLHELNFILSNAKNGKTDVGFKLGEGGSGKEKKTELLCNSGYM